MKKNPIALHQSESSFPWPRASELAYAAASALGPYLVAGLLLTLGYA